MKLSPCGVNCEGCDYSEQCGGSCDACKGAPFYMKEMGLEICALYDCSVNKKGYKSCAECDELPCQIYYDWKDPSMTDEQHIESVNQRVKALKEALN